MWYRRYGKRLFDLFVAVFLLLALSWLFVVIWLGYLIFGEYPLLYKQKRIGSDHQPFVLLKFRTLGSDESQSLSSRGFWWGKFLRFASLDELPQLWNVVKGEMSFVGPRPLPEDYLNLYSSQQLRRHDVRPGITGWAQVNGRNSIPWAKKFELDLFYVDHLSFLFDLRILVSTVVLVLSFKKDVSLEEQKFTGEK